MLVLRSLLPFIGGALALVVPAQTPPGGEVACYPFHGNANDHSGNGHHGVVFGATTTADRNGLPDEAYHFNGSDDRIDVVDFNEFGISGEVSVGFWVKAFSSHGNFCVALWPDDFYDRFECSPHYGHSSGNTIFWDLGDATAGGRSVVDPYPFVSQWEHFIFTSSAVSDRMRIYHDGLLIHEENHHSVLVNDNRTLGLGGGGIQPYLFLDGELDDVVIYDRELTSAEANDLFTYGVPCTSQQAIMEVDQGLPAIGMDEGGGALLLHCPSTSTLLIQDATGRLVVREDLCAGDHRWSLPTMRPGIYVATLQVPWGLVALRFAVR